MAVQLARIAPAVALALVAGTAAAATPPKQPAGLAAYRACLKQHGVTFGAGAPSSAKTRAAFAACRSKLPAGAAAGGGGASRTLDSAAFKKYAACMSKHGVTFKVGTRPDFTSAKFKAANKACASLRPKLPAGARVRPAGGA